MQRLIEITRAGGIDGDQLEVGPIKIRKYRRGPPPPRRRPALAVEILSDLHRGADGGQSVGQVLRHITGQSDLACGHGLSLPAVHRLAVEGAVDQGVGPLVSARGTQVQITSTGRSLLASRASGFMSGCLIFQRPAICSMTSFESIRTSTSASGSTSRAISRPAIKPRYSATLLVARPIVRPRPSRSRRSRHRGPALRTPPVRVAAGTAVGLEINCRSYAAPPRLAARRRRSPIRPGCRPASWGSQPGLRRADQDAAAFLAAQHFVVGRGGDRPAGRRH